jgi:hypothetical protein
VYAGQGTGRHAENRHAIIVQHLLLEVFDPGHTDHFGDFPKEPAEEIDRVGALLDELTTSRLTRVCAPFALVARPAANTVDAAGEDRLSDPTLIQ